LQPVPQPFSFSHPARTSKMKSIGIEDAMYEEMARKLMFNVRGETRRIKGNGWWENRKLDSDNIPSGHINSIFGPSITCNFDPSTTSILINSEVSQVW
jgi:hypothetical protein